MELDILTYNNNNNSNGGSNNNINSNSNNGLKPTKIAKLENDSKIVFSNVGCYQHDYYNDAHMLSFSSSSSSSKLESNVNVSNASWQNGSHCYSCSEGYMSTSMYVMNGAKAAFTPSQWVELEQQAMIYKYIIANKPIPHNLLISITRAFESACFSSYNGGFFRPNSFGWGPFYDPEPGRCRRTDGKKWRCSRDSVRDQKYCERHMNRGRHRSRKPVEGQDGHFASRTNNSKTNSTTNPVNMTSPSSASVGPGGGGSSNSFANTLNPNKDLHHVTRFDFLSPNISLNSMGNTFSINKEHHLYAESVDADALESNPHKSTILCQTPSENSTRVSISIPVPFPPDFMSSTSPPTGERIIPVSPSRLSHVGMMEGSEKQCNWVPISWETSIGGPLGEALKTSSNGLTTSAQ